MAFFSFTKEKTPSTKDNFNFRSHGMSSTANNTYPMSFSNLHQLQQSSPDGNNAYPKIYGQYHKPQQNDPQVNNIHPKLFSQYHQPQQNSPEISNIHSRLFGLYNQPQQNSPEVNNIHTQHFGLYHQPQQNSPEVNNIPTQLFGLYHQPQQHGPGMNNIHPKLYGQYLQPQQSGVEVHNIYPKQFGQYQQVQQSSHEVNNIYPNQFFHYQQSQQNGSEVNNIYSKQFGHYQQPQQSSPEVNNIHSKQFSQYQQSQQSSQDLNNFYSRLFSIFNQPQQNVPEVNNTYPKQFGQYHQQQQNGLEGNNIHPKHFTQYHQPQQQNSPEINNVRPKLFSQYQLKQNAPKVNNIHHKQLFDQHHKQQQNVPEIKDTHSIPFGHFNPSQKKSEVNYGHTSTFSFSCQSQKSSTDESNTYSIPLSNLQSQQRTSIMNNSYPLSSFNKNQIPTAPNTVTFKMNRTRLPGLDFVNLEDDPNEPPYRMVGFNKCPFEIPLTRTLGKCRLLNEFEKIRTIEEGSFGTVYKVKDLETGEICALQKIEMPKDDDNTNKTLLEESKELPDELISPNFLRLICNMKRVKHTNIVDLKELVCGDRPTCNYLLMEYCKYSLDNIIGHVELVFFQHPQIKNIMLQLLEGLQYLHRKKVIHRDLCPKNIMFNEIGLLKIGGFFSSRTACDVDMTPGIGTPWFKAPEILFGSRRYTKAVDIWSVGCIFAEMILQRHLLYGESDGDMVRSMIALFGSPSEREWPGYSDLPVPRLFRLRKSRYNTVRFVFYNQTIATVNYLLKFLKYNPASRVTVDEAMYDEYYTEYPRCCSNEDLLKLLRASERF